MTSKYIHSFQKIIITLTLFCFLIIWGGTFFVASDDFFTDFLPLFSRILLLVLAAFLLLAALMSIYRHLNRCRPKTLYLYSAILFAGMVLIYLFFIAGFCIVPINDSHSIMDQALSMARSGEKPMDTDSIYATYFSKYSNNYLLALIFRRIFLILQQLGITDVYTPLVVLNMLCLLAAALFTWLLARKVFGLTAAVKTLLLLTLNPVYYLSVFWVYSNTLSIPFMMAVIYLGICVYKANRFLSRCIYGILGGILCVLGYLIRPTAVIPVIAFAVCFACFLMRKASGTHSIFNRQTLLKMLQWAGIFAAALLAAGIVYVSANSLCKSYFGNVSDGNYPLTHWLMMGSHDNGRYNLDDDRFTLSFETAEEKKEATREQLIKNYKDLGVSGTFCLMGRKITTVWSDGYFDMSIRMSQPMRYNRFYSWLVGERADFFRLYCQSFWLAVGLLSIICCIRQLRKRRVPTVTFLLTLSLFGSILFYCLWEAKPAYAIPFLPLFFLLAQEGGDTLFTGWQRLISPERRSSMRWIKGTCGLLIVLCLLFGINLYHEMTTCELEHYNYSIRCNNYSWIRQLPLQKGDTMIQELHPNTAFNEITLLASATYTEDGQNDCQYHISLSDNTGKLVYETMIGAADISNNRTLTLQMDDQPAAKGSGYRLVISNAGGTQGDITFRTRKGICLDTYDGQFFINGEPQGTDLYLRVCSHFSAAYCNPFTAFCLCFGDTVIAVLILTGGLLPGSFRKREQQGSGRLTP